MLFNLYTSAMNTKTSITLGLAIVLALAVGGYMYFAMPHQGTVTVTSTPVTITQSDNGKTITVNKGDRFVLSLGELQWTIDIKPTNIVNRVKNIATLRGSQGVYTADSVGSATISAQGRPVCAQGQMCAQYIVAFSATVVVK